MKQKFICLLIIAGMFWCDAVAQPVLKSQRGIGGTNYDQLVAICKTKDGGLIAGGNSLSNRKYEKSQNFRGDLDYWVVKMDSTGKIQWDKTVGGLGYEDFKSVIQTYDGGYALIGESGSPTSDEKSNDSWGDIDYWLVKLDSAGNVEWDRTIGGSGTEYIDNIVQTKDSGYILAGSSNSPISGYKTEDTRGFFDYWVVKVDKLGHKIWDKTIGGSDYEFCSPVLLTNDGSILVGGFSQSNISGEKTEDSRGNYDIWLVKLSHDGKVKWDKTIGGNDFDNAEQIVQTDDGGYFMSGNSFSNASGEKTEDSRGGSDFWIVKTDAKGNKQWDKTFGGSGDDHQNLGQPLEKTSDGGYILGGTSNSYISGEKTEDSRGDYDYWIVKVDANGNKQWDKTIGGSSSDVMAGIKETSPNNYVAAGTSYSFVTGDKKSFPRGSADFWLVYLKYKTVDGIISSNENFSPLSSIKPADKTFEAFPNPAKDILNIHTISKAVITLINQSGKTILTKIINGNGEINVKLLPAGMYYLKNNSTGEIQKVMIGR